MNKVIREGLTFYIPLGRERAEIVCEKSGNELAVLSSYTPEKHRGKGLASEIMASVVSFAKKEGLRIVPKCEFAKSYCIKHSC